MSEAKLQAAKEFIVAKDYDAARSVLKSISDNDTAKRWLEKLDGIAPEVSKMGIEELVGFLSIASYKETEKYRFELLRRIYEQKCRNFYDSPIYETTAIVIIRNLLEKRGDYEMARLLGILPKLPAHLIISLVDKLKQMTVPYNPVGKAMEEYQIEGLLSEIPGATGEFARFIYYDYKIRIIFSSVSNPFKKPPMSGDWVKDQISYIFSMESKESPVKFNDPKIVARFIVSDNGKDIFSIDLKSERNKVFLKFPEMQIEDTFAFKVATDEIIQIANLLDDIISLSQQIELDRQENDRNSPRDLFPDNEISENWLDDL